jgi:hypothetical protein
MPSCIKHRAAMPLIKNKS